LKFIETPLPGVVIVEPQVFADDRGFFMETYHADRFRAAGIDVAFVQDNHSHSTGSVVRGLHYQEPNSQGKLVRCTSGSVFDVAVDIRRGSPHFGQWYGIELSAENKKMLWVPPGFAHGFCTLTPEADLVYKCTEVYRGDADRSVLWNDPAIGIVWPVASARLSPKDAAAPKLADAELPIYEA
jgi:dTDP-4-dehydrorhamnose 3,5-epimerase